MDERLLDWPMLFLTSFFRFATELLDLKIKDSSV
jgi:hypothetical protein